MSRIACIGSRQTPPDILKWMEYAGAELVKAGHVIVSGNAPGADQAWARGGNGVDAARVELCLPWQGFEDHAIRNGNVVRVYDPISGKFYRDHAATIHPRWSRLTPSVRKLHARNVMIVSGAACLLYYVMKRSTSGTKFGIEVARKFLVPMHDVGNPAVRTAFEEAAVNGAIFP